MEKNWRGFLDFSKQERIGLAVFTLLISIFLLAPRLMYELYPTATEEKEWIEMFRQIPADSSSFGETRLATGDVGMPVQQKESTVNLRPFDPNQLKEAEWVAMGISQRTARTIRRYIDKGGRFRFPEDLKKIWGLQQKEVQRLIPYVRITTVSAQTPAVYDVSHEMNIVSVLPAKIDINHADSAAWEAMPGIGPVLARRIVRFREMSGGFQSVNDLKRVYGLKDSVYALLLPYLRVSAIPVQVGMLNTLSARQLTARFSIQPDVARAMVAFREEHGSFEKLEDLKKIVIMTDSLYERICRAGKIAQ
jgi:DNA uptake protein ComE-like DNA-binding protein